MGRRDHRIEQAWRSEPAAGRPTLHQMARCLPSAPNQRAEVCRSSQLFTGSNHRAAEPVWPMPSA